MNWWKTEQRENNCPSSKQYNWFGESEAACYSKGQKS